MKKDTANHGVHRAYTWEIGLYALNNLSTNMYMMLVGYITYFLVGIVGVGVVLAGSLVTIMRVWDGVTDPFVGMLVDKTNTRLGKNRPFIIIGNVILFATTWMMFHIIPTVSPGLRFPLYIVIYMIYVVGYTCQCVVTKSAQSCLTNDAKQRPVFSMFDSVYGLVGLQVILPVYISGTLVPMFNVKDQAKIAELCAAHPSLSNVVETMEDGTKMISAFYNPETFQYLHMVLGILSFICAAAAVIGLWRKDRQEYFGTGAAQKITFKDYADVLAHNRGIQMLIVAASSDKLSLTMQTNSTIMVCLFGVICGNFAYYGSLSAISAVPVVVLTLLGMGTVARNLGQKMALVVGTVGSLASAALLLAMFVFGEPTSMKYPTFSLTDLSTWGSLFSLQNWSLFGVLFIILYCAMKGFSSIASSIVIPMTADCADFEVYRSGRYVPGLMGTLFSFVDKIISSFATTFVSLLFAAIGFKDALPTESTPYSTSIFWVTMACFIGAPVIGWLLNVVAMKFYPLTKEKMEEIQDKIAEIKARAAQQA